MGDMADMLLDQMWDEDECGCCGYDNMMYDEDTNSYYGPGRTKKVLECKYCGSKDVYWNKDTGRWLLYDKMTPSGIGGKIHKCPKHPLPVDVMESMLEKKKMNLPQILDIPSWDETFMHDVYWWARRSKDPRTKIGAVLVRWEDKVPVSHAYNGFARGVNDNVPARWERPEKYLWVSHAESNAVLNCATDGRSSKGTVLYTQGIPCADCANDLIQGKIAEIVVHRQWQEFEQSLHWDKWNDSAKRSVEKFKEARIKVRVFDKVLGMQGVLDGKVINI